MVGTFQSDQLRGFAGNDLIFGGAGDDLLDGGANEMDALLMLPGARLVGGTGGDIYYVDSEWDRVVESEGEGYDRVVWTAHAHNMRTDGEELYLLAGD